MWVLWLVLLVAVAGYFIYRTDKNIKAKFEDKFNPHEWDLPRSVELTAETKPQSVATPATSIKLGYEKTSSVLNNLQRPIFNALQQAIDNDYILLTNINAGDALRVKASNDMLAVQVATKNIAAKQFDFVVCDKAQLHAICAVVLGDNLDPLLASACEDAHLPLVRFKVQANYDVAVIRASLLNALGIAQASTISANESGLDIVDASENKNVPQKTELAESGITLEFCPECSAVMLKRRAKSGASAGKLFWICSTFPKCRGMLPVK